MIQKVSISEVKENPSNPRTIKDGKFKKLVKSIQDFPRMLEIRPIVVDEDGIVLGGNMRLKACKSAGLKEVHIIKVSDLTPEQKEEFIIKDNSGFGEWDWKELELNWDLAKLDTWGLEFPKGMFKKEAHEDAYTEKQDQKTDVQLGDLIEIGPHRLLCGSATDEKDMEKLMDGKLADLVHTDPPYNVDYKGGSGLTIMNDKMSSDNFYQFLFDSYTQMSRHLKPGGPFYIWHADREIQNFITALTAVGDLKFAQRVYWMRNAFTLGMADYHHIIEPALYGWKEGQAHCWYGDRKQSTVFTTDKPSKNAEHPTMKPILLCSHYIQNSSKAKDIVLDQFLGSGSTMVAAHQINRVCYGTELDPKYCQVIIDRMLSLDPTLEVKINGSPYAQEKR